jgi:hypothetical protein
MKPWPPILWPSAPTFFPIGEIAGLKGFQVPNQGEGFGYPRADKDPHAGPYPFQHGVGRNDAFFPGGLGPGNRFLGYLGRHVKPSLLNRAANDESLFLSKIEVVMSSASDQNRQRLSSPVFTKRAG